MIKRQINNPDYKCSSRAGFSCLKRIKSYLRNTMLQDRLSALSLFSIEKELLVTLSENEGKFYDDIIDKFAILKDRRINLTYKE